MAQQGSGLGAGPDEGAFKDQTSYNARSGAAKRTQTAFDASWGMKDMTKASAGVSPGEPGSGPDASSPNPLDPSVRGKKVDTTFKASWGAVDGHGKGVDNNIGGKVIGEAILSGSAKLPSDETYSTKSPGRTPG